MNTPVSFPLAKLLKQKGFDRPCREGWVNYLVSFTGEMRVPDDESNLVIDRLGNTHLIERPTIAEAVMWLYEEHSVWINAVPYGTSQTQWCFTLYSVNLYDGKSIFTGPTLNSPTEAYEAAIEYTLNNLI